MNTKILVSLLIIGLTAMAVGGAMTGAFFSDTEESTGNTFTAGTLNLQVGTSDATTYGFTFSDVAPGDTKTTETTIKNTGSIDAGTMSVAWTVTDSEPTGDTEPESVAESELGGNTYDISTMTEVVITYGTVDLTSDVESTCVTTTNGTLLLSELNGCTYDFGSLSAETFKDLEMKLILDSGTGNEYQGDQSTVEMTFNLEQ